MYGLNISGTLTVETLTSMKTPRCGVPDFGNAIHNDQKWSIIDFTWNFYMADLDDVRVADAAFKAWEKHSTLKFTRTQKTSNIFILYKSLRHTYTADPTRVCTNPFDGIGTVVAHAFYPSDQWTVQVEIHIDKDEPWFKGLTPPPNNMSSLLYMMIHEIGHSLGIHHSDVQDSVMFEWYHVPKHSNGSGFGTFTCTKPRHSCDSEFYGKPAEKEIQPVYSPSPAHPATFEPSVKENDATHARRVRFPCS